VTYHLVDPVVLDEQYPLVFIAEPLGELLKHLLLIDSHLLRAILVAVRAHLPLLLRVEDEREARRLERLEDEA